jgi:transcriptional regulator with XRE-family HTH domain
MSADARVAHQIGAALWRIRQRRGLRQYVVAEQAGVTRSMLSRYERGHACPNLSTLVKVLRVLDCDAETFGKHVGPWGCVVTAPRAGKG